MKRNLLVAAVAALGTLTASAALAEVPLTAIGTNPLAYPGQGAGPVAPPDLPLPAGSLPKFQAAMPVPVDYLPDTATFPGFDYYELKYAPVTAVGPWVPPGVPAASVPAGTQWLGLRDPVTLQPLYTPVWGFGAVKASGSLLGTAATYPSMNIHAQKGKPVKVRWVNDLPNQHLFCEQPTNANWPCAIDRTLMGTLAQLPPAEAGKIGVPNQVTSLGGPQQPDNAVVVHLHGGEIPPEADGFAELWFGNATSAAMYSPGKVALPISPDVTLPNGTPLAMSRPVGSSVIYNYPMVQHASTIWFHDHALGKTRINVAAGPAGFFMIDPPAAATTPEDVAGQALAARLPSGKYDINIAVQDRAFNAPNPLDPTGGLAIAKINFPNGLNQPVVAPLVPEMTPLTPGAAGAPGGTFDAAGNPVLAPVFHPQWVPEYFGDVSIVNGMAWPFLDVEPRKYRFRFLNGSNARCWSMVRSDGVPFTQIASEQGYLPAPVVLPRITFCPGERIEVVADFTGLLPGTLVTLNNNAPAPFPRGVPPKGQDVGKVMQFRVVPLSAPDTSVIPVAGWPVVTPLVPAATREMVLNEVLDAITLSPLRVQIDGKSFEGTVSETPKRGTTEEWSFVNTTGDAHPIHLHLVRFQVVGRQKFDAAKYSAATGFAVPGTTAFTKLPIAPYLFGKLRAPEPGETGWKDTAIAYPGEVLTVRATWDGSWSETATESQIDPDTGLPVIDPVTLQPKSVPAFLPVTSGPYVWHCHIVDHEDNEMMRPVVVLP